MSALAHTPYDGSRQPFSIGLKPLDPAEWIEPDLHLGAHLAGKERLIAGRREAVFREEAVTRAAQGEVLELLIEHLPVRFPDIYRRDGRHMAILPAGRSVDLDGGEPPLLTASRLVQEDFCLMRASPDGYRLAAASLCFPSAWSLAEKFGRPMTAIHKAVPHYAERLGVRIDRIFDNLKVDQPVWRLNWSIYADDELHHPESKERPRDWFAGTGVPEAFIRVERQTLRRLSVCGDILFTIKVHVDPFEAFRRHPDGARLAAGLKAQLLLLDEAQLAYKALAADRDRIVAALDRIVGALDRIVGAATIGAA